MTQKPILKVETEERAKKLIQIADVELIEATYSLKGRWYIVEFDCSTYVFQFLRRRLLKELQTN